MAEGAGFWLDRERGGLYRVHTHDHWMLSRENQDLIDLPDEDRRLLETLDRVTDVDEIRLVGVRHGLIRIRDHRNRISVQFFAPVSEVDEILREVVAVLPEVTNDKYPLLDIENLLDGSGAKLDLPELREKLECGERLLRKRNQVSRSTDSC